jgi:hypothetical protein
MKKLILSLIFSVPTLALAQSSTFNATSYGTYLSQVTAGNSSTGNSSVTATPVAPFNANASITLNRNGADAETVALTSVNNCYPNSVTCTIAGSFAYKHIAGETIQSGTFGLQEAINAAVAAGAGTVLIDSTWMGPAGNALILAAKGSISVVIQDNRSGSAVSYQWNGTAYAQSALTSAQLIQANRFSINGLTSFGDSITVGTGTADIPQYSYAAILGQAFGQPLRNYAVSGAWAADVSNLQVYPNTNPTRYNNVPSTLMIGTNDASTCTAGAGSLIPGCEQNYSHTLLSAAAWLTIPLEFKIEPQTGVAAGNCATTGTWTSTSYGNDQALSSTVPGSTLSCTSLTQGDAAVYANWFASDALTATATFSIDGQQLDTWNAFGFNGQAIATQNGTTQTAFATRYGLSGTGSHTYKVTVGTAGAGNAFTVLWIGSPAPAVPTSLGGITANPPRLALAGVPKQSTDTQSAQTLFYNNMALGIAQQLAADGALVYPVNVRAYVGLDTPGLNSDYQAATLPNGLQTAASTVPGAHPNGSLSNGVVVGGHRHLADAFLASMPPPVPATPWTYSGFLAASPQYQYFKDWDDGTVLATGSIGSPAGQSCTIVSSGSQQDVNHPGVLVIASGTVTSAGEACSPAPGFHAPISNLNNGSGWSLTNLVYTPTLPTASGYANQVGLATTLTANPWTTGVAFYLSSTNAVPNDWYCEYGSTLIDTGVPASTAAWTKLDIVANGLVVTWLINGQAVSSGCTGVAQSSIPSTVQNVAWSSLSFTSGTSFSLNVDYTLFMRQVSR